MSQPPARPTRPAVRRLLRQSEYFDLDQPIATVYGERRLTPCPAIVWLRDDEGLICARTPTGGQRALRYLSSRWPAIEPERSIRITPEIWAAVEGAVAAGVGVIYAREREWLLDEDGQRHVGRVVEIEESEPTIDVWRLGPDGTATLLGGTTDEERRWFARFRAARVLPGPAGRLDDERL